MYSQASIILAISCIPLCYGQAPSRTTGHPRGVHIAAVIPTEAGQIGINPVDIPPDSSIIAPIGVDTQYLTEVVSGTVTTTSWHASQTDFGTATITTTGTDGKTTPTTIPEGFLVALDATGKVEITLSQWLKTQLAEIASQIPVCAIVKRREWDPRERQTIEKRAPPTAECVRQRTGRISELLRERPNVMNQMVRLNEEVARVTGNDAVALAESDQMMAFAEEDIVFEIIEYVEFQVVEDVGAGEILAAVGAEVLGALASLAFFFGAVTILEDLWKLRADPQPMPIFKSGPRPTASEPASCPTATPACAGLRCSGSPNGVCTNEWRGCECVTSCLEIGDPNLYGDDFAGVEDLIYSYVFGPDPNSPEAVPAPKCSAGAADNLNLADVEQSVWTQILDDFCQGKSSLSGGITQTLKTSDIGLSSYQGWTFDFTFDTTRGNDCSAYSCINVFGKFAQCNYDSHTQFATGEIDLDCGTAKYAMNNPNKQTSAPSATPTAIPKTPLTVQNAKCYGSNDFGSHADIHKGTVQRYSGYACVGTALTTVNAGDPSTFISFYTVDGGAPYQYNVYWKDGCVLETGQTGMYAANPLNEQNPGYTKCQDILIDDYTRCNNGGVGGSIDYGCLTYEFKAQKK